MHDLRITGGTVVDGTGSAAVRADVAVATGRIVEVASGVGPARRTIDARGLVVAPGVVDTHTHLDAQLSWDPSATPSVLHGVTTVLGGNCGFSVAPLAAGDADYVRRMLARVEGMPLASLEAGAAWDWHGFGEWLARLDGRVGVNAGFFAGHSTLRRLAMGEGSSGDTGASAEEIGAMAGLLDRALDEGALGFTTSFATSHSDGEGRPVPSRHAGAAELMALAAVVGRHRGTSIGVNPGSGAGDARVADQLIAMSASADRVLNWNALLVYAERAEQVAVELGLSDRALRGGGCIVAEVAPEPRRFFVSLASGFLLDGVPGWAQLFTMSPAARIGALRDPSVRTRLVAGLSSDALAPMLRYHVDPTRMTVVDAGAVDASCNAKRIADLAHERRTTPLDVLLDLAVTSGLQAVCTPDPVGDDERSWEMRADVMADARTVIGAADAGAHLDVASSFGYPTAVLGPTVRRGLVPLERAIHELTDRPARLFGLTGRGRVAPGWWADLMVFDPERVAPRPPAIRHDLPGGARRIFAGALGVAAVLVNGVVVCEGDEPTGAHPGVVLRAGTDTDTVTVADGVRISGMAPMTPTGR